MPEYASICLHAPQYAWPSLNIAEQKMAEYTVLTMPGFLICCDIVVITLSV